MAGFGVVGAVVAGFVLTGVVLTGVVVLVVVVVVIVPGVVLVLPVDAPSPVPEGVAEGVGVALVGAGVEPAGGSSAGNGWFAMPAIYSFRPSSLPS